VDTTPIRMPMMLRGLFMASSCVTASLQNRVDVIGVEFHRTRD
jgi:hypothetical protein